MRVCFHDGVISQFEGYELLEELDWEAYRRKYGDIQRLDRILEAEGDSPNRYKLTKQADVVMLFYLLSADELAGLLERLGYDYDDQLIPRNIEYYEPRTSHGSTLSRVVHSWMHARGDRDAVVAPVPRGPVQRPRRRPGRHDEGGHPPRRHGGHRRPPPALLHRASRFATTCCACTPSLPVELGSLAFSIRYRAPPRTPRVHSRARPGARRPRRGRGDHGRRRRLGPVRSTG